MDLPLEHAPSAGVVPDESPALSVPLAVPLAADGRQHPLDPRYVPCARLGGAVFAGIVVLSLSGVLLFLWLGTDVPAARLVFLAVLAALLVVLAGLTAWLYPGLKLRHALWRLTPAALEIRMGVWFRHLVSVPRARVQHTDVECGPLERRFGLATLVVHTAGHQDSEVRLDGLRHETALAIRDQLLAGGAGDGA
jgi:membrane protein YdbS with pleckstrin-like domain